MSLKQKSNDRGLTYAHLLKIRWLTGSVNLCLTSLQVSGIADNHLMFKSQVKLEPVQNFAVH